MNYPYENTMPLMNFDAIVASADTRAFHKAEILALRFLTGTDPQPEP